MSVGLALFGILPGLARLLVALAGGDPEATQAPDTGASLLLPIVHGVSGTLFAVLGAFQFPTALRRGHRTWHRRTGRLLLPLGLTAAVSAILLTLFYPHLHDSGPLLAVFRVTFASALAVSILVAFTAIRRREIARHREWMIRAYALSLAAATQIFTLGFGQAIFGENETSTALLTGAAFVINLAFAEWVIRRRFNRRPADAATMMVQQRQPNSMSMGMRRSNRGAQ